MTTTYYSDSLFCLTYRQIWTLLAKQGGFGLAILVFPIFGFCKLVRWRFKPQYGLARPAQADFDEACQLPPAVRLAIDPYVDASLAAGLMWCGCGRRPYIGNKTTYAVVLLQADGRLRASIEWSHQRIGPSEASFIVFTCESLLTGDRVLQCVANATAQLMADFMPPWMEVQWLPPEWPPERVIAEHRRLIEQRSDVVPYNMARLSDELLVEAQRAFDFAVTRGILAPITDSEATKLIASTPSEVVPAELVR